MIEVLDPRVVDLTLLKEMEKIIVENQFITYPDYEYKDEYFMMWVNNIRNNPTYRMIVYKENNKILGFLNYAIEGEDNWICEIQVLNDNKHKGITTKLLNKYVELNYNIKEAIAFIKATNLLSKEVFVNHVGFTQVEGKNNRYKISIDKLKDYLKNKEK